MIAFRKAEPVFTTGSFDLVAAGDPDIFAYVRQTEEKALLVLVNLSQHLRVVTLPNRLIATGDQNYRYVFGNLSKQAASRSLTKQMRLAPYDAAVFEQEK